MADDDVQRPEEEEATGGTEPSLEDPPVGDGTPPRDRGGSAAGDRAAPPPAPVTASGEGGSETDRAGIQTLISNLPPRERNRFVAGTLIVHFPSRDVELPMDGESGLRLLAVLAGMSNDLDPIDRTSDALRAWMMVDRSDVIAAQWVPERSTVPRRATIDPAGLVDVV